MRQLNRTVDVIEGSSYSLVIKAPWQQGLDIFQSLCGWQLFKNVSQVVKRIHIVGFGRHNQAIVIRTRLGTTRGVKEQKVLALMRMFS